MKQIFISLIILFGIGTLQAQSRYELYCPQSSLDKSRVILYSQLGLKEKTGRNDGTHVELYLKSVGLNPKGRYPYCLAGQYYCFSQTSYNPLPKTGACITLWNFVRKLKALPYIPQIDDLIVWLSRKGNGHVERITKILGMGWIRTIGFNTTLDGKGNQRDGGGVYEKMRNILHPLSRLLSAKCLIGFKNER